MKTQVTVEELNAATVLLTGAQLGELVEVHIANGVVTAISADESGLAVNRIPLAIPEPEEAEEDEGSE